MKDLNEGIIGMMKQRASRMNVKYVLPSRKSSQYFAGMHSKPSSQVRDTVEALPQKALGLNTATSFHLA